MRSRIRQVSCLAVLVLPCLLPARLEAAGSTVIVNTAADTTNTCATTGTGTCSLRDAITYANSHSGSTINFGIGSGVQTITPVTPLPNIVNQVTIDGTTQPGFAGTPIIELNGAVGGLPNGLRLLSGSAGSVVRGLVINRFSIIGIQIATNGATPTHDNTVAGCFIGTDVTGTVDLGNGTGIQISASDNNTIGGTAAGDGNVISGNNSVGIYMVPSTSATPTSNVVQGNRIGTNATGTSALPNGAGVVLNAASTQVGGNLISGNSGAGIAVQNFGAAGAGTGTVIQANIIGLDASGSGLLGNTGDGIALGTGTSGSIIGGSAPGTSNTISGNGARGIGIVSSSSNTIQGNYIGTDASGTVARGNTSHGIVGSGSNNVFIGNVISGNGAAGISMSGSSNGNTIQGNLIGTNAAGTAALGNGTDGITWVGGVNQTIGGTTAGAGNVVSGNGGRGMYLNTSALVQGNRIGTDISGTVALGNGGEGMRLAAAGTVGGTAAGAANTIAFNAGAGIYISQGSGTAILGNSIFSNAGLGIDLAGPTGSVNPNDPCDADTGGGLPNEGQNYPILTTAFVPSPGNTTIQGTLNSAANTTYRIEFFSNATCDPSAYGEGQTYLGSTQVTTDGSCNGSFNVTFPVSLPSTTRLTATATDPANNTSEFSSCISLRAQFYTVTPCRVADTRRPNGPYGGPPLDPTADRSFVIAGQCGIPLTAQAVAFNFAIVQPTGGGHIRVYPGGTSLPVVAAMNFSAGQIRANNAIVPLGPTGDIVVHLGQGAGTTAHLVIDVNGYFE